MSKTEEVVRDVDNRRIQSKGRKEEMNENEIDDKLD